jgi:hypothetical protein
MRGPRERTPANPGARAAFGNVLDYSPPAAQRGTGKLLASSFNAKPYFVMEITCVDFSTHRKQQYSQGG